MEHLIVLLIIFGVFVLSFGSVFLYSFIPPKNNPSSFKNSENRKVIAIIGDSLTHDKVNANYIELVMKEMKPKNWTYINAGYNGYLTVDILGRIDPILKSNPNIALIWLGGNDLNGSIEGRANLYQRTKYFPKNVDFWNTARFKKDYTEIIDKLEKHTSARIILLTLPPFSEIQDSEAYRLRLEYSDAIREIAKEKNLEIIDMSNEMIEYLKLNPSNPSKPFKKSIRMMWEATFKRYLLRNSWNQISQSNGFSLLNDHLHLNNTADELVSKLIVQKIEQLGTIKN